MEKERLFNPESKFNQIYSSIQQKIANSSATAFLILAMALIALACSPIFTKLSESEISPNATIFNRLWIATIILTFWQQGTNYARSLNDDAALNFTNLHRNYKQQSILVIASLTATVSSLCWAYSLTQTSVASSTVLRSFTPIFIALGAWIIFREKSDRKFIIGTIISMVGGIAIGWDDLQLGREYLIGDGIALLSAALHGVNLLLAGYLRDRMNTLSILYWRCICGAIFMLPIVWVADINIFPLSLTGWLVVIGLAIVCQTVGQGLLIYSLKQFSSGFVGVFMLLKPIVSALLAWLIFAEGLNLIDSSAVILILFGIYLAKASKSSEKL